MGIKKVPFAYEHPNKRNPGTSGAETRNTASQATKERPNKKRGKAQTEPKPSPKLAATKNALPSAILLRLVVKPPKSGLFPLYDEMIASGLSPKEAILGLLKRGFSQFEIDISSNEIVASNNKYEAHGGAIETTRTVDEAFLNSCRDIFDKFGLLSDRALGGKIGEAIFSRTAKEG